MRRTRNGVADDLVERMLLDNAFTRQSLKYCFCPTATKNVDDCAGVKDERPRGEVVAKQG